MGGKVDLADFKAKTSTYQGKSIHLILKVAAGQNLQSLAGKDVNFIATGQRGEQVKLVIAIPASTVVPELGETDTLSVLFKCTRGSLLKGNETVTVELP